VKGDVQMEEDPSADHEILEEEEVEVEVENRFAGETIFLRYDFFTVRNH
jgi:hypothetical protein